jgi:hypothetical protein
MSATKEYYHDLIERQSRKYNILELQRMQHGELIEIASVLGLTVSDAKSKQLLIYAILEKQAES